jgi:hypothetical protein
MASRNDIRNIKKVVEKHNGEYDYQNKNGRPGKQ